MANTMPVTIRGKFVTAKVRQWDSFEDDKGKTVLAGRSVSVFVLDSANNLREIECRDIPMPSIEPLTFGIDVVVECEARPWNRDLKFTAVQLQRAAKVA